jgi:hypothetical protein
MTHRNIHSGEMHDRGTNLLEKHSTQREDDMSTAGGKFILISLMCILLSLTIASGAFGGASSNEISGRMAVTYNEEKGTATGMVAGYCQGEPVTIGPATVKMNQKEFSNTKVEDIGKNICGDDYSIKRVTRSSNNGKEMVADIVLVRNKAEY